MRALAALLLASALVAADEVGDLRARLGAEGVPERHAAAAALGALGEKARAAVPDLIDLLGDPAGAVRVEAARALVRIGPDREMARKLIARFESLKEEVGPLAAEAVARAGDAVVDDLIESRHAYAALALAYMGREGVRGLPSLLDMPEGPAVDAALLRLAPWGAPVVDEIVETLRFGDERAKVRAALVLGRIGPAAKAAIPRLEEAMLEGSQNLHFIAMRALRLVDPCPGGEEHPDLRKPAACKAPAPETYRVRFDTTRGAVVVEVKRAWSPHGADRLYHLVRTGFFTDMRIFRVEKDFVAQFGIHRDSRISGLWRGSRIADDPVATSNARGTLTFATAGPDARTTQLFFNLRDNGGLDAEGFSPVGHIVEGLEVLDKLYTGYGGEPDQQSIEYAGNAFLDTNYPRLDGILRATLLEK